MKRHVLYPWYLVLAMSVAACGDSNEPNDPINEDPPLLSWGDCPAGFVTECAYASVPLDYGAPDTRIDVLVSRRPAQEQPARAQLWLVTGGPGNSAYHFSTMGIHDQLADALPDTDVYVIEHRGVGYSSQLTCPEQQTDASPGGSEVTADEIAACVEHLNEVHGGGLDSFTVSNAARDIQHVLELVRTDGIPQYVYGVSYGTYLLQRFLRLFPDEVAGVILDSVATPAMKINHYDTQGDPVVARMAAQCAENPVCAGKLGPEPWGIIRDTVAALEDGHCSAAGLTGDAVSSTLWVLIDVPDFRDMLLPLLYRLSRCEPADIQAAGHFLTQLQAFMADTPPELLQLETPLLGLHLMTAEVVERPYIADELLAACEEATFCPNVAAYTLPYFDNWPAYEEPLVNTWPVTDTPILAFNGDMDVKTTLETASELDDHLSGPHQNFYAFPDGPHFLLATSAVKSEGAPACALQMMVDFVRAPSVQPEDACLDDLVALDIEGSAARAQQLFGTVDTWENLAVQMVDHAQVTTSASEWRRTVERLRRHSLRP